MLCRPGPSRSPGTGSTAQLVSCVSPNAGRGAEPLSKHRGRRAGWSRQSRANTGLRKPVGSAGCVCTLQTASWPPGFFVEAWRNFKASLAACCESSVAALRPPDGPLQNIDRGSGAAKVVVRRAAKTGLSFMRWRRPLTIVSAHVDFQLCDETAPTLPPHPWELGGGGLKIEPTAACSGELILHAAPVSSSPRQTLLL